MVWWSGRLTLFRKLAWALIAVSFALSSAVDVTTAQGRRGAQGQQTFNKELLNFNTVGIVTGKSDSAYLAIAEDLATVLDDGDKLRILAVVGKGAVQNVSDVLFLRNVDIGVTSANVLAHHKKVGGLGPNLESRLVYITKLFNEEVHIIAGSDSGDIRSLAGKAVNFGEAGSGSDLTARYLFQALRINVRSVNIAQPDALLQIKSGEIAATVLVAGKPSAIIERIAETGDYKLLGIPYEDALEQDYLPAQFTGSDYPRLVGSNDRIDTIAVPAVLAAYNWPVSTDRGRRLALFTEAFFAKFSELRKEPRHPKWLEVNLTAELAGWQRLPAARQWLEKNVPKVAAVAAPSPTDAAYTRRTFEQFLTSQRGRGQPAAGGDQEALFSKFLEFMQNQQAQGRPAVPATATPAQRSAPGSQPSGTRLW